MAISRSLGDFLEKYNDKKKKPNKMDIQVFSDELSLLLRNEGISDNAQHCFSNSPAEYGMNVLAGYLLSMTEGADEVVRSFISSKPVVENKFGLSAVRLAYLWSALFEARYKNTSMMNVIFHTMINFSYGNRLEYNRKILDTIRRSIFQSILSGFPLPDIKSMDPKLNIRTRVLLMDAAYVEPLSKCETEVRKTVYDWLMESKLLEGYVEGTCPEFDIYLCQTGTLKPRILPQSTIIQGNVEKDDLQAIIPENKVIFDWKTNIHSLSTYIAKTEKELEELQHGKKRQTEIEDSYRRKITALETELIDVLQRLTASVSENTIIKDRISRRESDVIALGQEISERQRFIDTITNDRNRIPEEYIKRLSSKLRFDFKNFLDAEGVEMSIELGENMREQLRIVFSILEKNGIKLR